MTRVLVVEDEAPIARALAINLRARHYEVDVAVDGRMALDLAARNHPDIVLLDLGLPDLDGTEVIVGLRGWSDVPILVLSARATSDDKVEALDAGADDYVTKPFGMDELLARLRAALRRTAPAVRGGDGARAPTTSPSTFRRAASSRDGRDVHLTPTEWRLLEVLVRNRGRLVFQKPLLQEVWGPAYGRETNYLRVYVQQLRRKLEPRARPTALHHHRARDGLPLRGVVGVDQARSSADPRSLPFFDSSGSVQAARLKQHGRRFPLCSFEMLTSTRRLRVSGFFVALTQRTHSHRAIGVISLHSLWILGGAASSAAPRSCGTVGSGQSLVTCMSRVAVPPSTRPAACCSESSTLIQWPKTPSGSSTVWNPTSLIVPWTATCPREGSCLLASSGNRNTANESIVESDASKRMCAPAGR